MQSISNINYIPPLTSVIDEIKENNNTKDNKDKTYTFEDILGQNNSAFDIRHIDYVQ